MTTDTETRVTTPTNRAAKRAIAATMVLAPILLLVGSAIEPAAIDERHGTDRAKSLQALIDIAPHRSHILPGVLLIALGLGLLVPAAIGLAGLAGGRVLALIGAALVVIGAPMGAMANGNDMVAYRLTDPTLSRASAVDVFAYSSGPWFLITFLLYVMVLFGLLLLGIAVGRSGALRWWQAILIALGGFIGFAGPEGAAGALFTVPLIVGMVLAARAVLRQPQTTG